MTRCGGALIVHSDGTTAACTEELEGRPCPGTGFTHLRPTVSCADVLGEGACESCVLEAWTDLDWRHAAHIGSLKRHRARCASHTRRSVTATSEPMRPWTTQILEMRLPVTTSWR